MKASRLYLLTLFAWCSVSESRGEKATKSKEDGSSSVKTSSAAPEQYFTSLTDPQRQMLADNLDRRMEKIRRIESKLEGLRQRYPKANMFSIVQEQLDEIKAQLDAV
jgi:hypothetical protein